MIKLLFAYVSGCALFFLSSAVHSQDFEGYKFCELKTFDNTLKAGGISTMPVLTRLDSRSYNEERELIRKADYYADEAENLILAQEAEYLDGGKHWIYTRYESGAVASIDHFYYNKPNLEVSKVEYYSPAKELLLSTLTSYKYDEKGRPIESVDHWKYSTGEEGTLKPRFYAYDDIARSETFYDANLDYKVTIFTDLSGQEILRLQLKGDKISSAIYQTYDLKGNLSLRRAEYFKDGILDHGALYQIDSATGVSEWYSFRGQKWTLEARSFYEARYNSNHQLINSVTKSYLPNGTENLETRNTLNYFYDEEGRVVRVERLIGPGGVVVYSLNYDGCVAR